MKLLWLLFLVAFCLVLSRLFFLQVVMGNYYRDLASENRTRQIKIPVERGKILDQRGEILAQNKNNGERDYRYYPDGEIVASVVGFFQNGLGVTGLEKSYNASLAGTEGNKLVEFDAFGKQTNVLAEQPGSQGEDLQTNLDLRLQKFVYGVLRDVLRHSGVSASSVIERVDGRVVSLISLPSFDPNLFVGRFERGSAGGDYASVESVLGDTNKKPLFNRTISGVFPPGSVYKLIVATAGLEEGKVSKDTLIEDTGEIRLDKYRFGNWYFDQYGRTEGEINLVRALARSNDIYFYRLGEKLGVDNLVGWSKKFGLGKKTGIDLPGESAGLVPDPLWSERNKGEKWFLGNTYHLSIGQGDLLVTPLQINRATASIVSGKLCIPRLVGTGKCEAINTKAQNRELILAGMKAACTTGGTAFPFFDFDGVVYCKTGTAQHGGEDNKPHAWISVVIPDQKGSIGDGYVITVMIEDGGEGSEVAGGVARKIVDYLAESF